jgi:ubiquinone/menaquinone biosynthesis C-methylase UbiE
MLIKKNKSNFPKQISIFDDEQRAIQDDWQKYWHEINKDKFSTLIDYGHKYIMKHSQKDFLTTLEVGPGLGEFLSRSILTPDQKSNYVGLEIRKNMAEELIKKHPGIKTCIADCQEYIPFPDNYFDRIIAVHVLEHLPKLPNFLKEALRVLKKDGLLFVVIPCEGGVGYSLGRMFTTKRLFEKRYKTCYQPFIKAEHCNTSGEIIREINHSFSIINREFYPLKYIPSINLNLIVGLTAKPPKG